MVEPYSAVLVVKTADGSLRQDVKALCTNGLAQPRNPLVSEF